MEQFDGYEGTLPEEQVGMFRQLLDILDSNFPGLESKLYHGSPVWFDQGNPLFGLSSKKAGLELLFWSGQGFSAGGLSAVGKFKAAGKIYHSESGIDPAQVLAWCREALDVQYDYQNLVKNGGELKLRASP